MPTNLSSCYSVAVWDDYFKSFNSRDQMIHVLNRGPAVEVILPGLREGDIWTRSFDTAHNQSLDGTYIDADSIVVFTNEADAT